LPTGFVDNQMLLDMSVGQHVLYIEQAYCNICVDLAVGTII